MKSAKVVLIVFVFSLLFIACGGVKNSTPKDTAQTFVQALIDGDEKKLNAINKSGVFDYPTHYLMSDFAPDYADRHIKDFSFDVDADSDVVVVKSNDGKINIKLKIQKIGQEYFFTGTER